MNIKHVMLIITWTVINSLTLEAKDTLVFAVDMIRHGDRTPHHALNNQPFPWDEGPAQLTGLGMNQLHDLGAKLRTRYVVETQLLPPSFKTETMYVRSTDYDRTLMSAQAFLQGLYPLGTGPMPGGFQPIPIHTRPKDTDILIPEYKKAEFEALLEAEIFTTKEWQDKTAETKPHWQEWSEQTGAKITHLRDIVKLGNILYIYQLCQKPLPPALEQKNLDAMIAIYKRFMALMHSSKAMGKNQLDLVTTYLLHASKKQNNLKYVLLSAHDSSMIALMSALGAPLDTAPDYASHLSIGLYESANEAKTLRIQVHFNDKLVSLPGCRETGCSLDEWAGLILLENPLQ